ncbi:BPI fold-containing family B member 6-like [Paroedura picta]|uniref:BPI fold-containing family B member 6-like n=1 Tax=Paroedura picta TaxID=143630 RepID=UPI004057A37B
MGLDVKSLQLAFLFFFWGLVAFSQGTGAPGPCARICTCTILATAKHSMADSHILDELAEAATKNQGSNKAIKGIKGLKVKDVRPPNITLCYVEKVGLSLRVVTQITIAGKSFIGGTMEITVKSAMITISIMIVKNGKIHFEVTKCSVELLSCKTNLPSRPPSPHSCACFFLFPSMLPKIVNKFLNSTLGKVLPGMMCPAADKVVGEMEKKMENHWVPQEVAHHGTVMYTLKHIEIAKFHATICFEPVMTQANGELIEIPSSPPASAYSPELNEDKSEITMPVNVLNAYMVFYKDILNIDVTHDTVEVGYLVSVTVVKERVPTLELQESYSELKFKIRSTSSPTWDLEEGSATLIVAVTVELVANAQEDSVFLISLEHKISVTFTATDGGLHMIMGDCRLENVQDSSSTLGATDLESLVAYLLDLLTLTINPALEKAVGSGIPIPSMMGSDYGTVDIEIHKNTLRAVVSSDCTIDTEMPPLPL